MKLSQLFNVTTITNEVHTFTHFLVVKALENEYDIRMSIENYNIENANIKNITADKLESTIVDILNQLPVVDIVDSIDINIVRNNSAAKTYRGIPSHLYNNVLFYHGEISTDYLLHVVNTGDTYAILKHPNFINMGVRLNYINGFKLTDNDIKSLKLKVIS